jgi:RNA polymerase sporulation-specific sigma factor
MKRGAPTVSEAEALLLVPLAQMGNQLAMDRLIRGYFGLVRLKASSYFLVGGDAHDLEQEGLIGLYRAICDFKPDRGSSFRNFAELCIVRQLITAIKTATRNKHSPLNGYVSFALTPADSPNDPSLDEMLPSSPVHDPVNQVIASEELRSLVACLATVLSQLESRALAGFLDGWSYAEIALYLGCDVKTVDNALQRVKRKAGAHLASRAVAA